MLQSEFLKQIKSSPNSDFNSEMLALWHWVASRISDSLFNKAISKKYTKSKVKAAYVLEIWTESPWNKKYKNHFSVFWMFLWYQNYLWSFSQLHTLSSDPWQSLYMRTGSGREESK